MKKSIKVFGKIQRYQAFTLAEVLITLGIIGVVAAMTIPTLVANYQKQILVTQLRNAYATVSAAIKQLTIDNGCPNDLDCTGVFGPGSTITSRGDELVKYFKIAKNCKITHTGCLSQEYAYYYDGTGVDLFDSYQEDNCYRFVTLDNVAYSICSADFLMDVNGPNKGPNAYGRDIFFFSIMPDATVYPWGGEKNRYWDNTYCIPTNKSGTRCAGRIIAEGWQMNY